MPNVDGPYAMTTVGAGRLWQSKMCRLAVEVGVCSATAASLWKALYGCTMSTLHEVSWL